MAKGKIIISELYCKGCGLCIEVCPKSIIELEETKITAKGYHPAYCVDESKCIACSNCALMCPDSAISVERF